MMSVGVAGKVFAITGAASGSKQILLHYPTYPELGNTITSIFG
jgi:hypothetical protein